MTKLICNKCMAGNPCSLDFIGTTTAAKYCPFTGADFAEWKTEQKPKPETALPDWCKVGEWVYYFDDVDGDSYQNIEKVDDRYIYFHRIFNSIQSDHLSYARVIHSVFIENAKQARLRPYNAKEMRGLVGKVLEWGNNSELVISYNEAEVEVYVDRMWCNAEYLMNNEYTIDGSPCGKLEHLEDGEWVE